MRGSRQVELQLQVLLVASRALRVDGARGSARALDLVQALQPVAVSFVRRVGSWYLHDMGMVYHYCGGNIVLTNTSMYLRARRS